MRRGFVKDKAITNLYILVADTAKTRDQYRNIYDILDDLVRRDPDGWVRLARKRGRESGRDARAGAYQEEGKKEIDLLWVTTVVGEPVVVFHGVYADPSLTGRTSVDLAATDWDHAYRQAGMGFLVDIDRGDNDFYSVRHDALSRTTSEPAMLTHAPPMTVQNQIGLAWPIGTGSQVRVGPRLRAASPPPLTPGAHQILERTQKALERLRDGDTAAFEHAVALLTFADPVVASVDHPRFDANPDWVHDWRMVFDPHQRELVGQTRTALVEDGMYGRYEAITNLEEVFRDDP